MKKTLFLIAAIALALGVQAQQFTVHAPTTIAAGQRFQIQFEVNDKASKFEQPDFGGLKVLSGPSTSSSSSFSMINGQTSRSVSTGFNYLLVAEKEGTYHVGSASCVVDGKKISSQGFNIKVEKGNPQQQQQNQQQGYSRQQQQYTDQQATTIDAKSLFARASISKNNPYQGEQVIITYKIYTQVPISQFQIDKLPGNKGFWSEDLSEGKEIKQYEETHDGRRYQVAEIRKGAMFAQESGSIRIAPLDLDVLAMVQRQRRKTGTIWDLFDDPFFNSAQAVEKHLSTNALTVNVKPLPSSPESFCGGVGHFDISDKLDLNEVRANEAITYSITFSGSGNLMLINAPEISFPQNVEVYDPETNDKISRTDGGVSGSRTFQWVLIPRSEGTLTIPEISISYFDPKTGNYVNKTVGGQTIKVNPGDPKAMQNVSSKSDVKKLNSDINYIKTSHTRLHKSDARELGLGAMLIAMLAELLIAAAAILIGQKRVAQQEDVAGTRLRRATKEARKRLKKAAAHLNDGNDELFYEEIYKAIWGCLADKFNIELSQLSSDTVAECLAEKGVADDTQQRILGALRDVDFARFAPGDKSARKQHIYDEALHMIASL